VKHNPEILHDRYARALFEDVLEDGTQDKVMEELTILYAQCRENKNFETFQ